MKLKNKNAKKVWQSNYNDITNSNQMLARAINKDDSDLKKKDKLRGSAIAQNLILKLIKKSRKSERLSGYFKMGERRKRSLALELSLPLHPQKPFSLSLNTRSLCVEAVMQKTRKRASANCRMGTNNKGRNLKYTKIYNQSYSLEWNDVMSLFSS